MDSSPPPADGLGPARLVDAAAGGLAGRLERWVAEARVDEAARARSRERWLRRQAGEDGTVAGVLADLLEAGAAVTVHTAAAGAPYAGVVSAVGADFVALGSVGGRGSEVVVRLAAVASVRTRPGTSDVLGDRRVDARLRLADVVAALADERQSVRLATRDGDVVAGVVRAVGQDVVSVRTGGTRPSTAYVPTAAIVAVVMEGREG